MTSDIESEILGLREKGLRPKEIARKLGLKVSQVSSVIKVNATYYIVSKLTNCSPFYFKLRITNCQFSISINSPVVCL